MDLGIRKSGWPLQMAGPVVLPGTGTQCCSARCRGTRAALRSGDRQGGGLSQLHRTHQWAGHRADGSVFGAQEGGRRVIQFLKDGSTAPTRTCSAASTTTSRPTSSWTAWGACGSQIHTTPLRPTARPPIPFLDHASVLRPGAWQQTACLEAQAHDARHGRAARGAVVGGREDAVRRGRRRGTGRCVPVFAYPSNQTAL